MGSVSARGFEAVEGSVDPDVTAIAAPMVVDRQTVAALSAHVPGYRLDPERISQIGRALVEATEEFGQTALDSSDASDAVRADEDGQ
ncbi:hypothetical protein [Streptomyces sp. NPDC127033]|uniref:hypothetical protein n=1 Tax=Streptomyces sp. NPDC127033 TaxID=3347110 RepID=UPI003659EA90